jgi:hypothetical protein
MLAFRVVAITPLRSVGKHLIYANEAGPQTGKAR